MALSLFLFFSMSYIILCNDPLTSFYQWYFHINIYGFYFYFGIDGISILFMYLTSFFIPLCLLFNIKSLTHNTSEYSVSITAVGFLVLLVFSVLDLFLFYIFFEAILIPFFFMIGTSGSRVRKIHATYLLFFYTLVGSVLMLIAICLLTLHCGTSNIQLLLNYTFQDLQDSFIWFCFAISFSIKVPIFPFHIWLPEAHVEAPTEVSVLLAAILLKIGAYGFLRILFPLFPELSRYYSIFLISLNLISLLFSSLATFKQYDIKRIIAYSSISHMNLAMLGFLSFDGNAVIGSLLVMIGHGFISGGLFFMVGMLYLRFKTRFLIYYSGLVTIMPLWSTFFFFLILSNISFPGTINFIGEFLILSYILEKSTSIILLFFLSALFLCTGYSIWLTNKLLFGVPSFQKYVTTYDLDFIELSILFPIAVMVLFIGVHPMFLIDIVYMHILSSNVFTYFLL